MASAHIKQSKTLANVSYSRQLYTPQHARDEAIRDVDRNKHFNDLESNLLVRLKKKSNLKKKRKQVKLCSRDTEEPCGYQVEVPQHYETSQQLPKV